MHKDQLERIISDALSAAIFLIFRWLKLEIALTFEIIIKTSEVQLPGDKCVLILHV